MSFFKKILLICAATAGLALLWGAYFSGMTYRMVVRAQWYETTSVEIDPQKEAASVRFSILKSDHGIEKYGGRIFFNYLAGAEDSGWDYALAFGRQDDGRYYRLMVSAERDEIALWKSHGGFLVVQNVPISRFKWYTLGASLKNGFVRATLDDKEIFSYRDPIESISGGGAMSARYGNALVFSRSLQAVESRENIKELPQAHIPNFRLADWRGGKWIFDGQEPIAKLDLDDVALYETKLKMGYQPSGYWELRWKQYDDPEWHANKLERVVQVASPSDRIILEIYSTTPDNRIESFAQMTVSFVEDDGSYEYETEISLGLQEGGDVGLVSLPEYLNFLAYNTIAPAAIAIEDAWQKNYEWILYTDREGTWKRQPINHMSDQSFADVDPYQGRYIYGVNEMVNPTISLLNERSSALQSTQLCMWAFDAHFGWRRISSDGAANASMSYVSHYKIANTPAREAEQNFQKSVLDPAFAPLQTKRLPIYRRRINDFATTRNLVEPFNEWTWSGNYIFATTTGNGDSYSLLLERTDKRDPIKTAYIDTAGLSYFTRLKKTPAGRYTVTADVKTEGLRGANPVISLASKHPEGTPTSYPVDVSEGAGWQKVSFNAYLPENTGIKLALIMEGEGKIWFDNVSWKLVKKDYFVPIKIFAKKTFGFIARRI